MGQTSAGGRVAKEKFFCLRSYFTIYSNYFCQWHLRKSYLATQRGLTISLFSHGASSSHVLSVQNVLSWPDVALTWAASSQALLGVGAVQLCLSVSDEHVIACPT